MRWHGAVGGEEIAGFNEPAWRFDEALSIFTEGRLTLLRPDFARLDACPGRVLERRSALLLLGSLKKSDFFIEFATKSDSLRLCRPGPHNLRVRCN